ncbi:MAG TPA: hypothetical protein VFI65_05435 [Streptosporangiaceae bacterium]|nr:hypothetical protein [Streptosporangiaceae bacterium]
MNPQSVREPPRWWTLPIPSLLTLPVAGWCAFYAAISELMRCFDTCMPGIPLIGPIGTAEFFFAVGTIVMLIVGLVSPSRRRGQRDNLWIVCVLAWLGAGYLLAWSSTHP